MSKGCQWAAFLFSVASAAAAPPTTTIQDTLYSANGTPMNATATITWRSFEASDTSAVGTQSMTIDIVSGAIFVQLVPSTTATPSQPYYVTYESGGKFQYQETWMVPPSTMPLRVRDVRISSTTTPPSTGTGSTGAGAGSISGSGNASGPLPESSVTGLASDLASRPVKGPAYGTGRVAIVDQNGAIDTVVGNYSDCVYVNGTSGPCFDPTKLPGYSDAETPSGVVDGSNVTFALATTPIPAQSLVLFRNGILQKSGFDYSISGQLLQFPAGAIPQPGDTLMAWYRTPSPSQGGLQSGGLSLPTGSGTFTVASSQVLCSANGTQTSSSTLTSLGSCTIPANFLTAGDRVDIRYLFGHTGSANGFTFAVQWGSTVITSRAASASDAAVSGHSDASINPGPTQIAGDSFGTVLADLPVLKTANDSNSSPVTITFQGAMAGAGSDAIGLVNYSVIRYPAVSNP